MAYRVFPENLSSIAPEIDFLKSKFGKKVSECTVQCFKGEQPPHRGLIAEKCISPLSEEIFSSKFQH